MTAVDSGDKPHLWPIFICYRRVDGGAAAQRLHETLDKWRTRDTDGHEIELDVYFDQNVPGVSDWQAMLAPYLEKARALIVICTPGSKLNDGPADWVHKEIDWWLGHRQVAPILIDPFMEGARYVPTRIAERWPNIQRIPLLEHDWAALSGDARTQKTDELRRLIIGAILPSGAEVYVQELEGEKRRSKRLKRALIGVGIALALSVVTAAAAYRSQRIAGALRLDADAAALFGQFRAIDARRDLETARGRSLTAEAAGATGTRNEILTDEIAQIQFDLDHLRQQRDLALGAGRERLQEANSAWEALPAWTMPPARAPLEPPLVFSIELLNAGAGESILVHYGWPDDIKVAMINAGPRARFHTLIEPRLRQLSAARYRGEPVPIELFVVSDRDEEKTGGLLELLENAAEPKAGYSPLADIRAFWANLFRIEGDASGFRRKLRELIDRRMTPLNQPFDHWLVRPDQGRATHTLPGGLEITVLGPDWKRLEALHQLQAREVKPRGGTVEPLVEEAFRNLRIDLAPIPMAAPANTTVNAMRGDCVPSTNAVELSAGSYRDSSVSNLASTILLFRFGGQSFLFTGDSRGDLIIDALSSGGILDESGRANFTLMSVPHIGSENNVTADFFRRVTADGYLFSGDGRFENPAVGTVASLVMARGCDVYRMYFVNRDDSPEEIARQASESALSRAAQFDEFFRNERPFNPNYRRVFRSSTGGSVIIDLIYPIRY